MSFYGWVRRKLFGADYMKYSLKDCKINPKFLTPVDYEKHPELNLDVIKAELVAIYGKPKIDTLPALMIYGLDLPPIKGERAVRWGRTIFTEDMIVCATMHVSRGLVWHEMKHWLYWEPRHPSPLFDGDPFAGLI